MSIAYAIVSDVTLTQWSREVMERIDESGDKRAPSFPLIRERTMWFAAAARSASTFGAAGVVDRYDPPSLGVVRRDIRGAELAKVANSSLDSNCLGKYHSVEVAN
jgi:hypothetical protein